MRGLSSEVKTQFEAAQVNLEQEKKQFTKSNFEALFTSVLAEVSGNEILSLATENAKRLTADSFRFGKIFIS